MEVDLSQVDPHLVKLTPGQTRLCLKTLNRSATAVVHSPTFRNRGYLANSLRLINGELLGFETKPNLLERLI
jgi:hypothetical protein